ncbi:MAG: helix-turn-helix domain-containing protein, partial [Acidimicrobiia bacterium]|nr:helix-turn-helix domain-containing protein [Acidimicrobiia bacterium]
APVCGCIRAIRDALGMASSELARRMGVSKARVGQIERGERERTITLHTLERAADALGCRVEVVLVPREPLDEMVWAQATAKARAEISAIDHTMALEDQRPDRGSAAARIEKAARHHVDKQGLWS